MNTNNKPRYTLEMYMEQGTEGAYWCIYDNTKSGYDGLIDLDDGMKINIVGVWSGTIRKNTTINRCWYRWCEDYILNGDFRGILEHRGWDTKEMSNRECKEEALICFSHQVAGGYHCHWIQEDVDPDTWASWFINELEVEIIE